MNETIHVLVAAPDTSAVERTVESLRAAGVEVVWRRVESRDALRAALDEEGVDLVLLDPTVPGVEGIEGIEGIDAIDGIERVAEDGHAEQRLRLLERAVEASPVMVVLTDREGRIEYVNPAFTRATGYTEEEMLGQTHQKLNSGVQSPELYQELWATIRSGHEWRGELTNRRKDGTLYDVDLTIAPVVGVDGEVTHFVALSLDISDRVRTEEELRQSERKYRMIVQNVPGVVYRSYPDGSVDFLADPGSVCGYTADEVYELEGGWLSIVHPDEREQVRTRRDRMFEEPDRRFDEYRIVHRDGGVRWVEDHKVSLMDRAEDRWVIEGLLFDVTERKTLENQLRQAQKMEAVGQLTGGIAHDFNNILTAISTNAEIVQSLLPAGSELQEDLAEILQAARRGATMIGRLLQFSRQGLLSMESVGVGRVASELRPMLQRLLPETIDLEIRDHTSASDRVRADVTAVEQILVNLCTNARDAMPEGGTLHIECERTTLDGGYVATHPWVEPGDYVALAVSDSGTGMDRATRDKAFEPFFTTKPTGKGSGLGLAMVYGLMKQHFGMVHIYSEPGTGTTVKLYFPVAEDVENAEDPETHHEPSAAQVELAGAEPDGRGSETILVVEDEPAIQRATRRALESTGYTVLLAADGEEALELFRETREEVALVISDLIMPNLGGRQLTDVLRGEGETVPILLTSGYSPESASGAFELPEGVAFLQKPWSLSELLEGVRTLLEGAR